MVWGNFFKRGHYVGRTDTPSGLWVKDKPKLAVEEGKVGLCPSYGQIDKLLWEKKKKKQIVKKLSFATHNRDGIYCFFLFVWVCGVGVLTSKD